MDYFNKLSKAANKTHNYESTENHFPFSLCLSGIGVQAQNLSVQMEELTAVQFKETVQKSSKTVTLPIGVLEKHGPICRSEQTYTLPGE